MKNYIARYVLIIVLALATHTSLAQKGRPVWSKEEANEWYAKLPWMAGADRTSEAPLGALDQLMAGFASCEVVDLTVTLAEHLPAAWPTHMPFQRKVYNWFASRSEGQVQPVHSLTGPYQTAWMVLDEHCGTHPLRLADRIE